MFSSNASQVSNDVKYIEDVCSVYLRTGTGSSQTVTTGIKENTGALVISKSRSAATDWAWYDTFRGATYDLVSNSTAAQTTQSQGLTAFNADGHTWGTLAKVNTNGATYVDTVLKPTPKFFDVVTYTGDGATTRNISHNLGSTPGFILVKCTSTTGSWAGYHRSLGATYVVLLNSTSAAIAGTPIWDSTEPTSTQFTVNNNSFVNTNGATYVAYLFAHNAGGFGLTGTDNVISCGSYTGNGSATGPVVDLGYEPQWVMVKQSSASGQWWNMIDVMRGFDVSTGAQTLGANASDAEYTNAGFGSGTPIMSPTATGFQVRSAQPATNASGATYIYIAIRRGPMKVPTSGTSVFAPVANSTNIATTNFPVDFNITQNRSSGFTTVFDRLRGGGVYLRTSSSAAEVDAASGGYAANFASNTQFDNSAFWASASTASWSWGRAPSFFDEVCYTGDGTLTPLNHNLAVTPELVIVKRRSSDNGWYVSQYLSSPSYGKFETTAAFVSQGSSYPVTSTTFVPVANTNGQTLVAYLFATCAGVSKVGSYTGTGTTQQINCGFTAGSRFVLIKRTDSTGDWYVWDSARGIVAGNDPYLLLNSTAAEVTNTDYIDTYSAGFEISSTAPAAINANGGTYIFLAIA